MNCQICGRGDNERAMVFRGEPYCSDQHRKELEKQNNLPPLRLDLSKEK